MLTIIFRFYPVARTGGVTCQSGVFIVYGAGTAANLYVRAIAVHRPITVIIVVLITITTALTLHDLVLYGYFHRSHSDHPK